MAKRIIVSVISDVVTDQRVQKECRTFKKMGYDVTVLGRKSSNSFGLDQLPFKVTRFRNAFKKGPLMYLHFNVQLFFYLLFHKADVLWANDLDTLLPNFLISKLKPCKLVYDSHEYFTMSVPKEGSRKVWLRLEQFLFPRLKNVITVNDSIRNVYEQQYRVPLTVIRNMPYREDVAWDDSVKLFPPGKKVLLIQGVGINENRGAEEAVQMMQYLPGDFMLYFIGRGTVLDKLREMVATGGLEGKVKFLPVKPYGEMMNYTRQAFLGIIFERIDHNDEHNFALPNRFFDYLKAGIPVLISKAVEMKALVDKYDVGGFIENFNPEHLAKRVMEISNDATTYQRWKANTAKAKQELCWENQEETLMNFMNGLK